MAYWLLKTEPEAYSFEDLERDGETPWDGVRNYQARNNLQAMAAGDRCLIYHSVGPREVVGIAEVVRAAYPDPSSDDERWVCVDVRPVKRLGTPVQLAQIRADPALADMALLRNTRLSVGPVREKEWQRILEHASE